MADYCVWILIWRTVNTVLINVYMHNDAANRKHFINDLEGYLITPREIILGGDFNFVENIELDFVGQN